MAGLTFKSRAKALKEYREFCCRRLANSSSNMRICKGLLIAILNLITVPMSIRIEIAREVVFTMR